VRHGGVVRRGSGGIRGLFALYLVGRGVLGGILFRCFVSHRSLCRRHVGVSARRCSGLGLVVLGVVVVTTRAGKSRGKTGQQCGSSEETGSENHCRTKK